MSAPERNDDNLEVKNTHCKCCGYIVERVPLPLFCDYKKLGFLGVGFPLFFSYIISCIYVLLIILCISGIFNLATNNGSEDCYSKEQLQILIDSAQAMNNPDLVTYLSNKECLLVWSTRVSLGNKRSHEETLTIQRWLNLATIVVLIVYFQFMRRNQRKIDKDCDESQTTPADYTVMVIDIKVGLGLDYDDELKAFFEENAIPGKKANIGKKLKKKKKKKNDFFFFKVNVNLAYNMQNKIEINKKQDQLVKEKQRAIAHKNEHGSYPMFYNETNVETQIKLYEDQMEAIEKEFLSGKSDKFCGIAFVTFATEDEKSECLNAHYKNFRQRCYLYFIDNFEKVLRKVDKSQLFFHDQRCLVFEAPEPSDVYWENLHYSNFEQRIREVIADSISLIMLCGFGVGIYYLNYYQAILNDESKVAGKVTSDGTDSESIKVKIIGALISVSVSGVIEILKVLIPIIAQ